jgi:hypothetical protein
MMDRRIWNGLNFDFAYEMTESEKEKKAAEGGLETEYRKIVGEIIRLNLYEDTKVITLLPNSESIFVCHRTKNCGLVYRVSIERLKSVIAELQGLPQGSTWDDIRPIVDPPDPLQTLADFQGQLESFGLSGLSFSCEEGEGRVVYRAFSSQGESARCVCDRDQWGYWSYQLELFVKKVYQASTIEDALENCPELMYREVIGYD